MTSTDDMTTLAPLDSMSERELRRLASDRGIDVRHAGGKDEVSQLLKTYPQGVKLNTGRLARGGTRQIEWVVKKGLPHNEGFDIAIDQTGATTLKDIYEKCEANPDCVGFAYWPSRGKWFPKRKGTVFFAHAKFNQWRLGEEWEWHYIKERAQAHTDDVPLF
eukprot:TRINITY_DN24246_c0_g1_i1.p1 TRINITY_DN24246_c0_g1~~TRINITY_DN24246_c0_g1_i1.p1  ORF type:complete len:177 (+),score=32.24 TRINITY_DN24246_c0_g1_i1:46-531(+)